MTNNQNDLRVMKTEQALCDAFIELLEHKRFEKITVNELCDKAMIRRATFYTHFADKYEFFAFFVRRTRSCFLKCADADSIETQDDYGSFLFIKCMQYVRENQSFIEGITQSSLLHVLLDIMAEEIYSNIYERITNNEEEIDEETAKFYAGFYTGGILQTLKGMILSKTFPDDAAIKDYFHGLFGK